ncbi:MAG: ABC transporter permease [Candidatus Thermochlorobacter aerophilum]|jgi:phospholipid/cholesterol/gamma-HCH transport system permease protein|uniref:ABC transporter permease n=1 Tax=Candidatus Thermochlorobacter aerophilus TaxID=1868324 RepID=A0A395M005_9BACT|nr:MAG: ABC transporter permease [Candidatus Thermochlorobacter aerophilum]
MQNTLASYASRLNERLKNFFLTMQEFFEFSMRTFGALGATRRYWKDVLYYMYVSGTQSLLIVLVSAVSIGGLLTFEIGNILTEFGAKGLIGRTTAFSVIRELGPLLTGIMLSARVGARNGSELGAMKISEQIDALRAFGTDPIAKLVVPRLVAALIMFPPLTALCDAAALLAGAFMAIGYHSLDPAFYWNPVLNYLIPKDFYVGFLKPPVFAILMTLVTCFNGFSATGGTVGVGNSTIKGIVVSCGLVMVFNFYISKLVFELL